MRTLTIAVVVLISLSNAESQILYNKKLHFVGEKAETTDRDIKASREYFKMRMKQRPNERIYGYVTSASLSESLRHLMIRCVIRNGNETLGLVFARLRVERDDLANFNSQHLKTFYIAIADTIPANSTRTYVFKQYLDFVTNEGSMILWNYYRHSSNPDLFSWTFTPTSVRRFRGR